MLRLHDTMSRCQPHNVYLLRGVLSFDVYHARLMKSRGALQTSTAENRSLTPLLGARSLLVNVRVPFFFLFFFFFFFFVFPSSLFPFLLLLPCCFTASLRTTSFPFFFFSSSFVLFPRNKNEDLSEVYCEETQVHADSVIDRLAGNFVVHSRCFEQFT